jgi:hypothetical protein
MQSWTWVSPFLGAEPFRFVSGDNLCIPDASHNRFVCIAAIGSLHCSKINESGIPGPTSQAAKRPPESGGLCIPEDKGGAYSAACLRGGSRAPESWISATW